MPVSLTIMQHKQNRSIAEGNNFSQPYRISLRLSKGPLRVYRWWRNKSSLGMVDVILDFHWLIAFDNRVSGHTQFLQDLADESKCPVEILFLLDLDVDVGSASSTTGSGYFTKPSFRQGGIQHV